MDATADIVAINPDWRNSADGIIAVGKILAAKKEQMSFKDFEGVVRMELGLDTSAALKIIKIAHHPILSKPEYRDKIPQRWGTLAECLLVKNEVLVAAINDGRLKVAKKYDAWVLRGKPSFDDKVVHGAPIKVPGGLSIEEFVRKGMAEEIATGKSVEELMRSHRDAGQSIGVSSYRMVRMAIMLLDQTEILTPADLATVRSTLDDINENKSIRPYYTIIAPIVEKVWGPVRNHKLGDSTIQKRIDSFMKIINVIHDTCVSGLGSEVPNMPVAVRAEALERISRAREAISQLKKMVQKAND